MKFIKFLLFIFIANSFLSSFASSGKGYGINKIKFGPSLASDDFPHLKESFSLPPAAISSNNDDNSSHSSIDSTNLIKDSEKPANPEDDE